MVDTKKTPEQEAIDFLVDMVREEKCPDLGIRLQAAQLILDHTRQMTQINNFAAEQRANRATK